MTTQEIKYRNGVPTKACLKQLGKDYNESFYFSFGYAYGGKLSSPTWKHTINWGTGHQRHIEGFIEHLSNLGIKLGSYRPMRDDEAYTGELEIIAR